MTWKTILKIDMKEARRLGKLTPLKIWTMHEEPTFLLI